MYSYVLPGKYSKTCRVSHVKFAREEAFIIKHFCEIFYILVVYVTMETSCLQIPFLPHSP